MVDIVERLRNDDGISNPTYGDLTEAADEIERLRKENREYLTEIINWKEEARLAHERGTGTTAEAG